jgi:uncharacterized DUF497 family protein
MLFKWNEQKNQSNIHKHGIDFDTASLVFYDPNALVVQDRIENGEERWQTIGMIEGIVLVLVAHTLNYDANDNEVIRIISARKADRKERKYYDSKTYR